MPESFLAFARSIDGNLHALVNGPLTDHFGHVLGAEVAIVIASFLGCRLLNRLFTGHGRGASEQLCGLREYSKAVPRRGGQAVPRSRQTILKRPAITPLPTSRSDAAGRKSHPGCCNPGWF